MSTPDNEGAAKADVGAMPAFPVADQGTHGCYGMTLRDYFAAKVMQAFMQSAVLPPGFDASESLAFVAARSYETADAMLAERSKS